MIGKQFRLLFLFFFCLQVHSQTTDLSIVIEAQDLGGTAISQINVYEDFQYVVTVLNSGNAVDDVTISINFDPDLAIISYNSQNSSVGASDISNISVMGNVLAASIATMPNNSSVELLVLVTSPTSVGGITANGTVSPPSTTQDINMSNNQSIISIDVLDVEVDFSVTHSQIQPNEGTAINAWGDEVTYQFVITNNSPIDYPVSIIRGNLSLGSPLENGQPFAEFISLNCIGTTNGTLCPDLTGFTGVSSVVNNSNLLFAYGTALEITAGGSITFEMVYRYTNFSCSSDPMPIAVDSVISVELNTGNTTSVSSNSVTTDLLLADACPETDLCIATVQTDPDISVSLDYGQDITFLTTVCNNGPAGTPMRFFFQNLSPLTWSISSVNCIGTTGPVACSDFGISNNGQIWVSSDFYLEANTTITIETVVSYMEPECSTSINEVQALIRSATNILDSQLVDSNPDDNYFSNLLSFPSVDPCPVEDPIDLQVTKIQTSPELPNGSSLQNTAAWGLVSYEITVTNSSEEDANIELQDYLPNPGSSNPLMYGTLVSVECIETTGTAVCYAIENANVGETLNGISDNGGYDNFWEITSDENWELPANSSVSFSVTVDWLPTCSSGAIIGTNMVTVGFTNGLEDSNLENNTASVNTYFAPCLDLVVQTYPEFSQVDINQPFNWIVDISNSTASSNAVNVVLENTLNPMFTIVGNPTCMVTSGNATCITNFSIVGNFITGIIPIMDAGSTVRISIPVTAPSVGGAFNNIAEAIPDATSNQELTPESNISINSVQVIAPVLQKSFTPTTISEGGQSELTFTVFNVASNPIQSNISFTDNLPMGLLLSSTPTWIVSNGCTATFVGAAGDAFVGIENLVFPDGVESCTFSVLVTVANAGTYLNNFQNFSNNNNIDTSQTNATLNVTTDTSDVDIEIIKTVMPSEAAYGQNVEFTILATNLGTTTATLIEVVDALPQGFQYVSATVSFGVFDAINLSWNIPSLDANTSETLVLTVSVVSSDDLTNVALLNSVNEVDRDATNNEDDATVEISNCLTIPEGISPNNDGSNDVLSIPCIEDYPENTFKIYNRYGTQIYEAKSYLNTWDGKANMGLLKSSGLLPVGTYFYVLEINGFNKPLIGYVYLNY